MGWISPSPPSGDNPIRVTLRMGRTTSHFSEVRGIAELQTRGFCLSSPGGWPIPSRLLAGFSPLYRSWLVTVPLCWLIPSPTRVTLRPSRPVSPLLLGRCRIPSHHLSLWREHPSGERRWRWGRNVHTRITKTTGAPPATQHQKWRQKGAPSPLSLSLATKCSGEVTTCPWAPPAPESPGDLIRCWQLVYPTVVAHGPDRVTKALQKFPQPRCP